MTELYINGYLSVLPNNIEFSIVEDNAFLTKSGEYSFDFELDLQDKINSKIFKHINRFNSSEKIETLPAILIVDNQVRLRGIAVILRKTNKSVKIHLLSGNSELNYFIGSDQKIIDTNLGEESEITETQALDSLNKKYPEANYVCAPVMTDAFILNKYQPEDINHEENISDIAMMPYLLYYVQKIIEVLGYQIKENQLLDDECLCRTYIVNGKRTLKYSEIIGGLTIESFLTEIEKFCNVVFVIDKESSSVRIIRNYNRGQNIQTVYINEVIDDYPTDYDDDNEIDTIDYDAVTYSLPGEKYYRYKCLDDDVLKNVTIEDYETFDALYTALGNDLSIHYNNKKVYHVEKYVTDIMTLESDNYYIVDKSEKEPDVYILRRVNEFRESGKKEENLIELKIIPAKMDSYKIYFYGIPGQSGSDPIGYGYIQLPSIALEEITDPESLGVVDLIESGTGNNDTSSGEIPVAIYFGMDTALFTSGAGGFPFINPSVPWSQVDCWIEPSSVFLQELIHIPYVLLVSVGIYWNSLTDEQKQEYLDEFSNYQKLTLRLSSTYGTVQNNYSKNEKLASKEMWTISFIPDKKISTENDFIIKNKKFICISLETRINNQGALPIIEGKFYPID